MWHLPIVYIIGTFTNRMHVYVCISRSYHFATLYLNIQPRQNVSEYILDILKYKTAYFINRVLCKCCCCNSYTTLIVSGWVYFRFKGNIVTTREEMSEDTVLLSEQQHTWHMAKRADTENRSSLSTGEYTLDQALEIHLKICLALLSVRKHNTPVFP